MFFWTDIRKDVERLMRKWTDAFCEGNGTAVTALSTEDFILLPQSSPTLTKKPGEGSLLCQFIITFLQCITFHLFNEQQGNITSLY